MRYILSLAVDPGGGPWARGPPPVPYILSSGNFLINNVKREEQMFCKTFVLLNSRHQKQIGLLWQIFSSHIVRSGAYISLHR